MHYETKTKYPFLFFQEINRSNRRIMKQTFVSDVLQIPDHIAEDDDELKTKTISTAAKKTVTTPKKQLAESNSEEDDEEDDWEKMYDENGECLDPKIMQELTASVGKCKIELPKMDYSVNHFRTFITFVRHC